MNTEEEKIAAKCAKWMGLERMESGSDVFWFASIKGIETYNPCANTPQGREQAEVLKARLRELQLGYVIEWLPSSYEYVASIAGPPATGWLRAVSTVCENAALAAAVAKMQTTSEEGDE